MLRGFQGKRLFAALLCMLMILSAMIVMPHTAFADDADDKEMIDYVLILDCTSTAMKADEKAIRVAAAKMFIDLIPVDNARVAVFRIGERDRNAQYRNSANAKSYKLRDDDGHMLDSLYRMQCVYQLWDFNQPVSTVSQREELKSIVDTAYNTQGWNSDTHCAVYAAIDTLKYWNSENACILLVSEEFTAYDTLHKMTFPDGTEGESDHTMWDDIQKALFSNRNWVLNWIDIGEQAPQNREVIEKLCQMNGGESCYDFEIAKLPEMIASVVSKYSASKEEGEVHILDASGKTTVQLPPFIMLTEANVIVTGDGVEKVSVIDGRDSIIEKQKDDVWFSNNYDPQNRARFLYTAVKLIRPAHGAWKVNVSGKAGTQVYVQAIHTLEPDILLTCTYQPGDDGMIGVGTNLQFTASFQYAGENLHCGNDAYNHYLEDAKLYYTHSSNPNIPVDISNTLRVENEQYVADYTVQNRGTYTFYFYVKSYDFESGSCSAKPIENITVENHAPKASGVLNGINDVSVGSHLDAIMNITEHFSDEDNEALTYYIDCSRNGRSAEVNYQLHDDGYLSIDVPVVDGKYDFRVYAEDSNGAQSEALQFSLTAVNEAPQLLQKNPMKVRMIANAPQFLVNMGLLPKDECKDLYTALSDVFADPEGLPLEYQIDLNSTTDKDGNEIVSATFDKEAQSLTISAHEKGEASIFVIATDSSNATGTLEVAINVVPVGSVLFARYWWVIALLVLVAIIVAILLASRRVKLCWNVTVKKPSGSMFEESISNLASRGKKFRKTKIDLVTIIDEVFEKNDEDNTLADLTSGVIVFKGVLFGNKVPYTFDINRSEGISAELETAKAGEGNGVGLPAKGTLYSRDRLILTVSGVVITIDLSSR